MNSLATNFVPRSRPWDTRAHFSSLDRRDVALSDAALAPCLKLIDDAMVTEFDSQNLDNHFSTLAHEGLMFTPEFLAFRAAWRADEWSHYIGYRRLLHLLTSVPEAELHHRTVSRPCDFSPLAPFLEDEFLICMVLAYDEIVTRHACSLARNMYRLFGHQNFLAWINLVGRDEGWHFRNLIQVIRICHRHRTPECAAVPERLLAWDVERQPYHSTFVLDHDLDLMDEAMLRDCAKIVWRATQR
jgi:hypothetical protein